jgi:hypothetical protein
MEPANKAELLFARGGRVAVVLTLVGSANHRLVYIVRAMAEAGLAGMGPARARLELENVVGLADLDGTPSATAYAGDGSVVSVAPATPAIPPTERRLHIALRSPLRLRLNNDLVTPARFVPADLVVAAIRRVSSLAALHCDAPVSEDFAELSRLARSVSAIRSDLRWHEQQRFSGRQKERLQAGGIVGSFEADLGDAAPRLFPWLALGQWVGAGKGASMGLGQYRIFGTAA